MGEPLLFAAVADDDTGASDLAGMFADQGVRTMLVLDPAFLRQPNSTLARAQGVVLATATRALPKDEAYRRTADAVHLAAALRPRTIQIKYCSTFDSTPEGNIGPSIDAAMDTLPEDFTIALPALPVNGRTTYLGYHFVNGQLLSDSPMRHHPLTPMTNPNLVDLLGRQTARKVGLTSYRVVDCGPEAIRADWQRLRSEGVQIAIVDCLSEQHAAGIAQAACGLKLISGGSAFGTHLPSAWRARGWLEGASGRLWEGLATCAGRGRLVVAGSCSVATAAQNAWLARSGAEVLECHAIGLIEEGASEAVKRAIAALQRGETVLLKTQSSPNAISAAQAWGAARGLSVAALGLRIAESLAAAARVIVCAACPEVLVSAGGETSGALCRALGIRALAIQKNIQPGVPLCLAVEGSLCPIVLKSGNFGSEDFYAAAFAAGRGFGTPTPRWPIGMS